MSVNDPFWSYGQLKFVTSSGATMVNGDDAWSYGLDTVYHEYVAPAGGASIMNQLQKNNLGSDLFNGTII